jgi:hypothetical protein
MLSAGGCCHFFRLSGEIPDPVYAYALSLGEDGPLRYYYEDHSKGIIFLLKENPTDSDKPAKRKNAEESHQLQTSRDSLVDSCENQYYTCLLSTELEVIQAGADEKHNGGHYGHFECGV